MINEIQRMQQLAGIKLNELGIGHIGLFKNFDEVLRYTNETFEADLDWIEDSKEKFLDFINAVIRKYPKLKTPENVSNIIDLRYFNRTSDNGDKLDIADDDLYFEDPEIRWIVDIGGLESEISKIYDSIMDNE